MQEPSKGLELDGSLVKQLTGGDAVVARFLGRNPFKFNPVMKITISCNDMPKILDSSVLRSGRIKNISFDRHFSLTEQDVNLSEKFMEPEALSGILNWLIEGFFLYRQEGRLIEPDAIKKELEIFRSEATGQLDDFLAENLVADNGGKTKTHDIHLRCQKWAQERGFRLLSQQAFVGELRARYEVKRLTSKGNVVVGHVLKQIADGDVSGELT